MGRVQPSWSPDIDYTFNPKPSRSTSLRVGPVSTRTAGIRQLKASERASDAPESKSASASSILPPPTSACSEIIFTSGGQASKPKVGSADGGNHSTESWRHTWVYSPGEGEIYSNFSDDTVLQRNVRMNFSDLETPADSNDSLYFTIAESPVVGRGEVTLRFIEKPLEGPLSYSESPSIPASPEIQ